MAFTLISVFINSTIGFFLVDMLYWIFSLVILGIIMYISWRKNMYSKLGNFILLVGILFSFFGYLNNFDPSYFYLLINLSAFFAVLYTAFNKKILIILSWLLNGFSLGYIIASLRNLNLGIIFGIIIFLIGLRDAFLPKKFDDHLNN
ncbi:MULTISPECIES: hypothetical protein [Petrotoga]|uniref:Uncharacterized protein n=2 Tax=Petrotoga sibirica TaxID=156202 RepID=A0A4R8EEE9_9BACT|nr:MULTISPECIES: hypothetical protein [Petrotoga]KUK83494.1 MAG: hypothetical protein XD96_0315 [Petrotoga mobilis]POZ87968.1 hypothetical protein AA80_07715 [Petrotoga sibirica DSM 13575]POZ90246.1 hypothetical protein AD60_07845 [Petrotoga sp. SL27]TDX10154.1 hypothetical protein C8D74_12110 [Petrotoga sibirica]